LPASSSFLYEVNFNLHGDMVPSSVSVVVTNKRGQSVSVFDLKSGHELARLPTKRNVPDGVVISPDSLYAFVAVEGIGSEPGTVEVIDLHSLKTVATVDVPEQAVGIDFWKVETPAPVTEE